MASLGIATRRWYLPLLDRHPAFAHMSLRPTPVADNLAERLLGIPFHVHLDHAMQSAVVNALSAIA